MNVGFNSRLSDLNICSLFKLYILPDYYVFYTNVCMSFWPNFINSKLICIPKLLLYHFAYLQTAACMQRELFKQNCYCPDIMYLYLTYSIPTGTPVLGFTERK
jgi:hypothetical protein